MNNPINSLSTQMVNPINQTGQRQTLHNTEGKGDAFTALLKDSLASLETKQSESAQAVQSLIDGSADDLHSVMIKTTEAQLSLEIAVQMRNRALEAYNEIKNMQF